MDKKYFWDGIARLENFGINTPDQLKTFVKDGVASRFNRQSFFDKLEEIKGLGLDTEQFISFIARCAGHIETEGFVGIVKLWMENLGKDRMVTLFVVGGHD